MFISHHPQFIYVETGLKASDCFASSFGFRLLRLLRLPALTETSEYDLLIIYIIYQCPQRLKRSVTSHQQRDRERTLMGKAAIETVPVPRSLFDVIPILLLFAFSPLMRYCNVRSVSMFFVLPLLLTSSRTHMPSVPSCS